MTTWAQVVNGQALNVVTGDDLATTLGQCFAPGFDGGHPEIPWTEVPDGTISGASTKDDESFNNPVPAVVPTPVITLAQVQSQLSAINAQLTALSSALQKMSS